jgi:lipopolysaccharide transport system permease protein
MGSIRQTWAFRAFIRNTVQHEFQARYRNSLLGVSWALLGPLAQILVYTLVFSKMMRGKLPQIDSTYGYSIYLCVGLLTWGYFADIMGRGLNVFLDNANLIKKIRFPHLSLPVIALLNATVNFSFVFGLFLLFLLVSGSFPGWPVLAALPILAIVVVFAIGLGIIFGVINVFFRDVGPAVAILLQFWFWLTPIVYPVNILPDQVHWWLQLNPLFSVVVAMQTVFVYGYWPDWLTLLPTALLGIALCGFGWQLYRHRVGDMFDQL